MKNEPPQQQELRAVIDDVANQLCLAVDGKFDFTVSAAMADETVEKLAMLVNFVLDNARRALTELERRNESLSELDRLKSDFVANVSHELRTPLALILGPAERMLSEGGSFTDPQRRDLEVIRRNAAMLLKHVNDLLDVSKLETRKMEIHYTEVDLSRLVRIVAGYFEALAPQREISFDVEVPPDVIGCVDVDKIERVLLNLLSNAFKFAPTRGRVKVSLTKTANDRAMIAVQDSGPGVRLELRTKVFERFRQGDTGATRQFGGTGLGLSIAKDFVDLHGGTIEIGDAPGGGARFVVELPLDAPHGARVGSRTEVSEPESDPTFKGTLDELRPVPVPTPPPATARPDRPTILVVEDNPEMSRFLVESLGEAFNVETAMDGREGLDKALAAPPDLLVTDLMMPGMSGDQMTFEIRRHREFDNVPILVLSAKADDALRIQLLGHGAQDYVLKPFSSEELRARADNWVKVKRARELLQSELSCQQQDLEQLAAEVTAKTRELRSALEAMTAAREEAERARQVKDSFLSMASHELRTPLTTIRLQLDRLQRDRAGELSEKQKEMVHKASTSSQRLLELVESLLEYTRLESGPLRPQPERFDPIALCTDAVDELRPRAEASGLDLRLTVGDVPPFSSDPRLLRLVLLNLIDNAIKFTEQGSISVFLSRDDRSLRLSVKDTGRGIAPELQSQVFEPFEQLEDARQKHKPGVGLGLAIVKRIVAALEGELELHSEVDKGTEFTVSLPEVPEAPVPPDAVLH